MLLAAGAAQAQQTASGPEGDWARGDGKARVRIAPCDKGGEDGALCAINTWMRSDVRDEKTGDRLIMTVTPKGTATWQGKAYDPQRKLTYRLIMKVTDTHMTTRGCVLGGLVCKSMTWTRLESRRD